MDEKELIEGISFPIKYLDVYINKAYSVSIDGDDGWCCDDFGMLDVYDSEKQCNHSKTIYTESDIYEGDKKENIISCIEYLQSENILRKGIDYQLFFGEDNNEELVIVNVDSNGNIIGGI